ncbi:MAG: precorrin-3B C(17)-methyltransferase [Deltaproteobacteria bacterium]|nr:precorrin-3B C(17)-methyltransferase [Deltaproteobacteria bacterium]
MLFLIGMGPGGRAHMTQRALEALAASDVIVGYSLYIELLGDLVAGKEVVSTGMTQEIERCRAAVDLAVQGRAVSVVSTGDPGVYGMAGLTLELLAEADPQGRVPVEVVPGVSAVHAAASRLGAPLMTDFAVVSLSDLLTPWETIRARLAAAASADFVVALYNPRSRKRRRHLEEACEILLEHRPAETPAGVVRNALRRGEEVLLTTLAQVPSAPVDMMSVVIVGNRSTRRLGGWIVTPRGYPLSEE